MNTIRVVGIDIAKSDFRSASGRMMAPSHGIKNISRSRLQDTVRQFELEHLSLLKLVQLLIFRGEPSVLWNTP